MYKRQNKVSEDPTCIRCGRCVEACPMHLEPLYLYLYVQKNRIEDLEAAHVMDCIECGACSYICPGRLHLTHSFKVGKQKVKEAAAKAKAAALKGGEIMLLENTRFEAGETKNDPELAKALASMAELYVSDAFGTVHRAHASTAGVAAYLPAVSGLLVAKELEVMGKALDDPKRPFVAVLGGAKVSDKIAVINNLLDKADTVIIGGGMAYTFAKAQGGEIGKSLLEEDKCAYALEMIEKAKQKGVKLLLPVDTVCIKDFPDPIDAPIEVKNVDADKIPADYEGLDIGPKTAELFANEVKNAKTVVWNGPMGVFENPTLAAGTIAVAKSLAETDAVTIIGGGDSAAAVNTLGFGDKMTHISTGGGASLEFLEGKELPGIAALNDK